MDKVCYNGRMITNYRLEKNKLVASSDGVDFILVSEPSREEIGKLAKAYDFPFDYIGGILDDDDGGFEACFVGIVNGVIQNCFAVAAHGVDLLESAVAAAHAGSKH